MSSVSSLSLSSEDDIIVPDTKINDSQSLEKSCKVCGDRAIGYNFSVITCESCKAFFRRNANRQESLKCPFNQKCVINVLKRRFCQSCRLQRCFQVGMKKEWIMREGYRSRKHRLSTIPENDEEIKKVFDQIDDGDVAVPKQVLVELIKKSTMRRLTACQCRCTCGFYPTDTKLIALSSISEQRFEGSDEIIVPFNSMNQISPRASQENFYLERGIDYPFVMTNCMTPIPQMPVSVLPEMSTAWSGNIRLTTSTTMQQAYISDDNCFSVDAFERLLADDKILLQELVTANDILKQPLDLSTNQRHSNELSLMDVVRMTDLALRRIINMAKELTFFKRSCSELLILRGVMVFDQKKHAWNTNVIQGSAELEIKLDILKNSKELKHYEEHKRFLTTFGEKWGKNEYIMLLLNAITLFSPFRTNLQDIQKLQKIRQKYCDVLRRYLGNLYVASEAEKAYQGLLKKLGEELNHLSHSLLRIYHSLNNNELNPLLCELFDLAQT
uniref:Nuclear receptor domain-containing protein n=1 Tax=Elaeophora elaphi TaxID=1147741 RepID=A0A0R3S0L7_9BILA